MLSPGDENKARLSILTSLTKTVLKALAWENGQESNKRQASEKERVKLYLYTNDMIVYVGNPKEYFYK